MPKENPPHRLEPARNMPEKQQDHLGESKEKKPKGKDKSKTKNLDRRYTSPQ